MDKEQLIPGLRFSGYNDVWKQHKANEVCSIGTGKSNTQDQVDDGKYPFYIRSDVPVRSNKYLYDCEAVITIGDGNIGKVFHYVNGKFDLHQRCYKMTDFKDIWGKYFFYYFSTKFYDRAMRMTAKATVDSVRLEMISEMDIKKPPQISEQKQIAEFFTSIDHLITLHQNEYDKLLIMKKTMLEKMFPKNGSEVPEVRFSEFDGAWGYRKLGTISDKVTEKNVYMEYTETLTNSAEYGIISQRDFFDHDIAKQDKINGYYVVRPEDFVYNPRISTTAPVGPIGRNKLERCGVISPLYTVFRPKEVDNSFLEQFFKSSHWYSFMRFNGDTGARSDRFSIKDTTFFEMPIPFPKLNEQRRIGQYLAGLDFLISLQDKKLTKLKNIKAGCLEKMFV